MGDVLEIIDALVAEIADQPAGKARQLGDFRRFEPRVERFDKCQRVAVVRFGDLVVLIQLAAAA